MLASGMRINLVVVWAQQIAWLDCPASVRLPCSQGKTVLQKQKYFLTRFEPATRKSNWSLQAFVGRGGDKVVCRIGSRPRGPRFDSCYLQTDN